MTEFSAELSRIANAAPLSPYLNFLDTIRREIGSHPLILYGAGDACGIAVSAVRSHGLAPVCVCDGNKTGIWRKGDVELPIIKPKQLAEEYPDAFVLIDTWRYEKEIRKDLAALGLRAENIFTLYFSQRVKVSEFEEKFYEGFEWAYGFFADAISKKTVVEFAESLLLSQPQEKNTEMPMYYNENFGFGDNEVYLDGGCAEGTSISRFIELMERRRLSYAKIYAFEPDARYISGMSRNIKNNPQVEIHTAGLSDKKKTANFYCGGRCASTFGRLPNYLSSNEKVEDVLYTTEQRELITIDDFFMDKPHFPTYIKLDIEGYEGKAIAGARALIERRKPKIAVTTSYCADNIYLLPQMLHAIRPDYKFQLRRHWYGYYEIVLYAW
jgi:FkbM family methyltransferase